jgi:hypothetical protein
MPFCLFTPHANCFSSSEHIVGAYYFIWYQNNEYTDLEGDGRDPDDNYRWEPLPDNPCDMSVAWHKKEIKDMMDALVDVAFVDTWSPSWFWNSLDNLVTAVSELKAEGYEPPKLALFFDTPVLSGPARDLTNAADLAYFYDIIKQFYNAVPDVMRAKIDDKPLLLFFIPYNYPAARWVDYWNADTFSYVKSNFLNDFGETPYILTCDHLHGDFYGSWNGVDKDGNPVDVSGVTDGEVRWFASLGDSDGPLVLPKTISLSPGYWFVTNPYPDPTYPSATYPKAYRHSGARYTNDWTITNSNRSGRFLAIIESWNELFEGTNISESKTSTNYPDQSADSWGSDPRSYIDITAQYAKTWNDNVDFDCTFIEDTIPTSMAAGGVYNAIIRVRNTGDEKWLGSSFLLAQDDTDGVPGLFDSSTPHFVNTRRVGLGSEQIYRGKPLTFDVILRAPLLPGIYVPQWKILKNSSLWSLGSLEKVIVVAQQTSARFWQLYK